MAEIKKGDLSLDLGLIKLGAELTEEDRQCAWELYTEIVTRVAVSGKRANPACNDFSGELYIESFASIYEFFQESRKIMRQFPVGRIKDNNQTHLGWIIQHMLTNVLRPFLEKWHGDYRNWWEHSSNAKLPPFERQKEFPRLQEMLDQWGHLRLIIRQLEGVLAKEYKLTKVM
jgi:hypothetical protein